MQLKHKREALEAALAAAEGEPDLAPADDGMSDVSSIVSGMSAYTTRSGTVANASSTATGSSFAPSTVGGRRPQRANKRKVGSHDGWSVKGTIFIMRLLTHMM